MQPEKNTILLIEGSLETGESITHRLRKFGYAVIWLRTFDEALDELEKISSNPKESSDILAIIFDYQLDKDQLAIPLVEIVSEWGFSGPLIANSSDDSHNSLLQKAGCTHTRPNGNKVDVVKFIMEQALEP